jgi:peroxiredoxin
MRSIPHMALPLIAAALVVPAALRAAPGSLKVGEKPENFELTATDGKRHSLHLKEAPKATAVFFVSARCPISIRYDGRMIGFAKEYQEKGIRFIGINSNDPEPMEVVDEHAKRVGYPFPVVKDPNNVIADKWGAQVTPEVFLLDQKGVLQYHGRIDDQLAERKVTSPDLKNALEAVLAGKKPEKPETKASGCDIKRVATAK